MALTAAFKRLKAAEKIKYLKKHPTNLHTVWVEAGKQSNESQE